MPVLLVERRAVSRAGSSAAGLSLAHRFPRRSDRRPARRARRSLPPLPVPFDHELHQGLPEGSQSGEGHRRDQEDDGSEKGLRRKESRERIMLDHVGFAVSDLERARKFYQQTLSPLGIMLLYDITAEQTDGEAYLGFGEDQRPYFWVG